MEGAKLVAHRGTQLVRYEDPAQYGPPGANDRFFTVRRGTRLRRDTVIPQWFQASKAAAASDGHAVHC